MSNATSANPPAVEVVLKRVPSTPSERALQRVITDASDQLLHGVTLQQLTAAFSSRDVAAVASAFHWDDWQNALARSEDAFHVGFRYGAQRAGFAGRFDIVEPNALRYAREASSNLIVQVTNTQRAAVRDIASRAIYEGIPPVEAAKAIRNVVGLHSRYATAVFNFERGLIESGVPEDVVARRAAAYAGRLRTVRSQTIARTELQTAANRGRAEMWDHAMGNGLVDRATAQKQWLATGDDRTCEICAGVDTELVGVGELFSIGLEMPPAHPDCRCVSLLVPGTGGAVGSAENAL